MRGSPGAGRPRWQIDRLKIGPEPSAEAACSSQKGVHVGATVQEQHDKVVHAATDRPMKRRGSRGIADVHETRICLE